MTDAPAAIKGTLSDFKLVKTRKLAQLVIEIPIEEADAALAALGGVPRPDAERWVAIARLDPSAVERPAGPAPEKERRAFCDLPMSQQAALKCGDADFSKWVMNRYSDMFRHESYEPSAEEIVLGVCNVERKRDILANTPAGNRWLALLREFEGVR